MSDVCLKFLEVGTGKEARRIAVRLREGSSPGLLWLGGFKSDMQGIKAQALDRWASEHGRAVVRFDYSGHGESGGDFAAGKMSRRLEGGLSGFKAVCRGAQIFVGSSLGGWVCVFLWRKLHPNCRAAGH